MTLESKRQAVRDYHARRTATGSRKVTVWLSEAARGKLAELARIAGSKDQAAERAIMETAYPLYSVDEESIVSLVEDALKPHREGSL